jgi:oligopeptide/dipeptide ABC transporter ATP-binding protein
VTSSITSSPDVVERDGAVAVVEVQDLKVYFQAKNHAIRAVDGVSFRMLENEIIGLVGETGCGKSVTARSLIGLLPIPPAIIAGGSVIFRPGGKCLSCRGAGCGLCNATGTAVCGACGGAGCQACGYTGRPTLDLLKVTQEQLRAIRGVRIAMIFQDPSKALNPALNVRQQIAEVLFQHRTAELLEGFEDGIPALVRRAAHQQSRMAERLLLKVPPLRSPNRRLQARVDDLVAEALGEVQIANPRKIMRSYPHELSGGMKQRVMIAQAMACDPDVLIADEPTTALDTTVQARILELILDLQRRRRAAVLYISHDLSLVRLVCDRVAVMYAGQIAEMGDADEVFHHPKHPYTQALLSAIPSVAQRGGKLTAIRGSVPEFIDPSPSCRFSNRCPHAAAICPTENPPLRSYWANSHEAACFAYESAAAWGRTEEEMPILQDESA